eukprot:CAMPEP_0197528056 /NCGR_PEP_ID=MMETSP1318-20131121/23693_1 /TAXON_ID=552666 /ORGANISM="Partenskyella glossopodia, Strain RCC365" /LENGTH=134 /DNA_ID=CAMNT_0043082971 /DNA_START=60 /DNA_END=461 /DNA_ORIENTATION=+
MHGVSHNGVILALAVIGKENEPLFMKTYRGDSKDGLVRGYRERDGTGTNSSTGESTSADSEYLSLQFHIHTSLDIVDEKVASGGRRVYPNNRDLYIGQLFTIEDYNLFGYVSNSRIKFIVLIEGTQANNTIKTW